MEKFLKMQLSAVFVALVYQFAPEIDNPYRIQEFQVSGLLFPGDLV